MQVFVKKIFNKTSAIKTIPSANIFKQSFISGNVAFDVVNKFFRILSCFGGWLNHE